MHIQILYIGLKMSTSTVNISFDKRLLEQIDNTAEQESRSRSELIREASRMYIEKKKRWNDIFSYGKMIAKKNKLKETDIIDTINAIRKKKRK